VETSKTKNERCEQAEARAAGKVGMREPKKRQGSVLKCRASSRTRKRGRDAVNLSAEQGIAMHSLTSHATGPGDLESASAKRILVVVVALIVEVVVGERVVVSSLFFSPTRSGHSPGRGRWHAPSSRHLRALLSVCGRCSFGGLGCCPCRVRVCRCRGCGSLSVCVCMTC